MEPPANEFTPDDLSPAPWPATIDELETEQRRLADAMPAAWSFPGDVEAVLRGAHPERDVPPGLHGPPELHGPPGLHGRPGLAIGGCFICFGRDRGGPGAAGDRGWAAAVTWKDGTALATAVVDGGAGAAYDAGHLALREGPLLERAVHALEVLPEVLLVNSTGRDHPRRAGMALHLGARLGLPTVGVTNRLLVSIGSFPADTLHTRSAFGFEGEITGWWVRTRPGTRPLAVHAAWRTDARTALAVVLACTGPERTPVPLRLARQAAREARTRAGTPR